MTEQEQIERLQRELDVFTKAGVVEISVRNQSVSDYMTHWEGRALKAESTVAEQAQEIERLTHENQRLQQDRYPGGAVMPQYAVLGIGVEPWVDLEAAEREGTKKRYTDRSHISLRWHTFRCVMNVLRALKLDDFGQAKRADRAEAERDAHAQEIERLKEAIRLQAAIDGGFTHDKDGMLWKCRAERAEAERDALRQQLDQATAGWQPIETAPKDGTRILLFAAERVIFAHWLPYTRNGDVRGRWFGLIEGVPTHWMPLPAPPKETP